MSDGMTAACCRWRTRLRAGLLAAALLATAGAGAADWKWFDTEHYTVYARARTANAHEFATRLELLRWLTLRLIGNPAGAASIVARHTDVYLVEGKGDEDDIKGSGVRRGTIDCLTVTGLAQTSRLAALRSSLQVIQELVVNQVLIQHASLSFPDRWHAKGFAQYVAATEYVGGELLLGGTHEGSGFTLLQAGKWLPWDTVLRLDPAAPLPSSVSMDKFNAQAWWLVNRLMSSAEGKQALAGYLERRARAEDPVAALEAASGRSAGAWRRSLWEDFPDALRVGRVRPELLPKVDVRPADVDPQVERYLGLRAALYCQSHTQQSAAELRRRLHERVADAGPAGATLTLDLALADLNAADPAAAIARLEPMIRSDLQDVDAHLLLATAWRQSAVTLTAEARRNALERAADHATRALQQRPDSAEAWRETARTLNQLGRPKEVLQAFARAHTLEPPMLPDSRLEAKLALAGGDPQRAVQALEAHAYQSWWPDVAHDARAAIAAIRAGRPAAEVEALIDPPAAAAKP